MRLVLDTSGYTFQVTRAPSAKIDQERHQKIDKETGDPLWVTQVLVLDDHGGEVVHVTTAGAEPQVDVGDEVRFELLLAIPWAQNGRNGVAFRGEGMTLDA